MTASFPEGVEAVWRVAERARYLVPLNHTAADVQIELPETATALVGDEAAKQLTLPPYGVRFLRTETQATPTKEAQMD